MRWPDKFSVRDHLGMDHLQAQALKAFRLMDAVSLPSRSDDLGGRRQ